MREGAKGEHPADRKDFHFCYTSATVPHLVLFIVIVKAPGSFYCRPFCRSSCCFRSHHWIAYLLSKLRINIALIKYLSTVEAKSEEAVLTDTKDFLEKEL